MISREETMTKEQAISCMRLLHSIPLTRELHESIDMAIEALSQPPADQWIPCSSEHHPIEAKLVQVTVETMTGRYTSADYYSGEKGRWQCYGNNVIAWMPLPEPYKGEQNDR
jgi:hypothetical protein